MRKIAAVLLASFGLYACAATAQDRTRAVAAQSQSTAIPAGGAQALTALHEVLAPLRPMVAGDGQYPDAAKDNVMRGATPALTTAKHLLRDWFEAELAAAPDADPAARAARLNQQMRAADLLCTDAGGRDHCETAETGLGYTDPIAFDRLEGNLLVLRTGFGIACGSDESAYAYKHTGGGGGGGWSRFWQSEQAVAPEGYSPQHILAVQIADKGRLVLTLGNATWCSSTHHDVYYRLWRVTDQASRLLLDEAAFAYFGDGTPIHGRLGDNDLLVEADVDSIDPAAFSHTTVRHYTIAGDEIERIAPIALNARGFTEEWLHTSWNAAHAWSAPTLAAWHDRLHSNHISGDYDGDTTRCTGDPNLRQVAIDLRPEGKPETKAYFLIRWEKPARFTMIAVAEAPRGDCIEAVSGIDAIPNLFGK